MRRSIPALASLLLLLASTVGATPPHRAAPARNHYTNVLYEFKMQGVPAPKAESLAGYMDVRTFSYGYTAKPPAGGKHGSQVPSALQIVKLVDTASPVLEQLYWNQKVVANATLDVDVEISGRLKPIMELQMTNVVVTNIQSSGTSGALGLQQVTLSYQAINVCSTSVNGSFACKGWNYMRNAPQAVRLGGVR